MAEQQKPGEQTSPQGDGDGTSFKREGPVPSNRDTGKSVEEMNRAAEESVVRNVTPDEQTD